ncbi:MAG: hypothetical protein K0U40_02125 [Betaproteobacteria bacterium]|nr:hypothetical protein [Betaproteobacteria bacterium]
MSNTSDRELNEWSELGNFIDFSAFREINEFNFFIIIVFHSLLMDNGMPCFELKCFFELQTSFVVYMLFVDVSI